MGAGRPKSAPWTLGTITVVAHPTSLDAFQARGRYRDADGRQRQVTAAGTSQAKAREALKAKVRQREKEHRGGDATLNQDTSVAEAAQMWLAHRRTGDGLRGKPLSPNTLRQYGGDVERYITRKPIATRSLASVNKVPVIESWLKTIANDHGRDAARTARKVLGNILGYAERRDAIGASVMARVDTPYAESGSVGDRKCSDDDCDYDCGKRHLNTSRAFTREEAAVLLEAFEAKDAADIADLGHFLFGTGVRVHEALECVSWADIEWNTRMVRVRGTKTKAADRKVKITAELLERLATRAERWGTEGLVFGITRYPTKAGKPRDKSNVLRSMRRVMAKVGMQWAGSHTFRRTVATWEHEAGVPLNEISKQLGHSDSTVTMAYFGRDGVATRAADVMTLSPVRPMLSVVGE